MASFSVNINRNEGSVQGSGTKLDKAMLKELKMINAKLGRGGGPGGRGFGAGVLGGELAAGFGGKAGLGSLLKGGLWAMIAAGGLFGAIKQADQVGGPKKGTQGFERRYNPETGFMSMMPYTEGGGTWEKYVDEKGNAMVGFFDEKTGELLETMTKSQAEEEGLLDARGELKDKYTKFNSLFDDATSGMEKTRDGVILQGSAADELFKAMNDGLVTQEEINMLAKEQKEVEKQILEKKKQILSNMGGSYSFDGGPMPTGIPFIDSGAGEAYVNATRREEGEFKLGDAILNLPQFNQYGVGGFFGGNN